MWHDVNFLTPVMVLFPFNQKLQKFQNGEKWYCQNFLENFPENLDIAGILKGEHSQPQL